MIDIMTNGIKIINFCLCMTFISFILIQTAAFSSNKGLGLVGRVSGLSSLRMIAQEPKKKVKGAKLKTILNRRSNPKPVPNTGAKDKDMIENTDTMPAEIMPKPIPASEALTDSPTEAPVKKIPKVEGVKINSNYLYDPLQEEMVDDRIFVGPDAVVVLKYHGSYQQDNRDKRARGKEKEYSFMLRLKQPNGECPPHLYKELDNMCDEFGQGDLRATTRQAFQLHGILKGNLKTVINKIIACGSSTVGACGDVSRNVMCPPAPFMTPEYKFARQYCYVLAELFKPMSPTFTELWETSEIPGKSLEELNKDEKTKVADIEYWNKDLTEAGFDIPSAMLKDTGKGIILDDKTEPIYGKQYLPRKFKTAVTVPGDNSLDIYTNDIGLVVITDPKNPEELLGFNVMVGGGMGRTHMKDTTFARLADHLGFVSKDNIMEVCKAILATQRDHGNRDVRPNARMKYLVYEKGIEKFRELVRTYLDEPKGTKMIETWKPLPEWEYKDWMGWHEQGDGKYFCGINVVQGRVKDYVGVRPQESTKYRTAFRQLVDELNLTMILSPTQSVIFRDIESHQIARVNQILANNGIPQIDNVDDLVRKSIACPSFPLCGLAVAEAERRMPYFNDLVRKCLMSVGLGQESLILRMTGCPNGCARPYMAELALVGSGPDMYQVWVGGSPALTRLNEEIDFKIKWMDMEAYLTTLFTAWRDSREAEEAFGDWAVRMGVPKMKEISASAPKVDTDSLHMI